MRFICATGRRWAGVTPRKNGSQAVCYHVVGIRPGLTPFKNYTAAALVGAASARQMPDRGGRAVVTSVRPTVRRRRSRLGTAWCTRIQPGGALGRFCALGRGAATANTRGRSVAAIGPTTRRGVWWAWSPRGAPCTRLGAGAASLRRPPRDKGGGGTGPKEGSSSAKPSDSIATLRRAAWAQRPDRETGENEGTRRISAGTSTTEAGIGP